MQNENYQKIRFIRIWKIGIPTTRKVEYPESGVAHFSATPENWIDPASIRSWTGPESIQNWIIWQAISLANRRLTGHWKSKIIGGVRIF